MKNKVEKILMKNIGFIGSGKMAQAMIEGMLISKILNPENIMASAVTEHTLEKVKQKYGICTTNNNTMVAKFADILILAVKPDLHTTIIDEIKNDIQEDTIIVTIAAGITLTHLETYFGKKIKAIRAMPNTPSLVGEGMCVICPNDLISEAEIIEVEQLFHSFGKTERLEEKLMDAVPAISGSSPAYIFILLEAMADGAVRQGIPREKAYKLASQAVLGAAKMVRDTGLHPGELKDNVCTPGGATIEAVAALEKNQLRGAIMAAMESCTEKVKRMSLK